MAYRVILVDNEPWVLTYLDRQFPWATYHFEVIARCSSSLEAYRLIKEECPDVVITDIRMPELSGLQLMEKIRSLGLEALFVIVSGFADFSYAQQALRLGAFDYCLKPIDPETADGLLKRLYDALGPEEEPSPQCPVSGNASMQAILQYIQNHYCEKLRLKDLAAKFYLNPGYCSTLFVKTTGRTFPEYLTALRVEKACSLLKKSSLSISEIASAVGIDDYFYFGKVFKKATGISPGEYRKRELER